MFLLLCLCFAYEMSSKKNYARNSHLADSLREMSVGKREKEQIANSELQNK